jgi:two-component system, cell cycle sensor histidine kinase and response regulator CckA
MVVTMEDRDSPPDRLLAELREARKRVAELEAALAGRQAVPGARGEHAGLLRPIREARASSHEDEDRTQSIDLRRLLTDNLTSTGSFDVRGDIWATTFGKLLQALPIPSLLIDRAHRVIGLNQACGRITPDYQQTLHSSLSSLFSDPDAAAGIGRLTEDVFLTRKPAIAEEALRMGDVGIWSRMTFRPLKIGAERFILLVIEDLTAEKRQLVLQRRHQSELRDAYGALEQIVEDRSIELKEINRRLREEIEERKKTEKALKESERIFKNLLEDVPVGLSVMRADRTFEYLNRTFTAIFGYTKDDVPDNGSWFAKVYPDGEYRRGVVSDWERAAFAKTPPDLCEPRIFTVRCKDGTDKIITFSPVTMEAGKQVIAYQDLTSETEDRAALAESEERYRDVTENSLTGICLHQDGVLCYVNRLLATLVGYTPEEMVGKPFWDFVHPDDREMVKERGLARSRGETRPPNYEFRAVCRNGDVKWFELRGAGIPYRGRYAALANLLDITERKRSEDALREIVVGVSSQVGEKFFDSTVSHFAKILEADYTFVGEVVEKDGVPFVRTLAYFVDGGIVENIEYPLQGTPCEIVVGSGTCAYVSGTADKFPFNDASKKKRIEGYVGVALNDSQGRTIGVISAMYRRPVGNLEFARSILQVFAARTAAEIERRRGERALLESEERYRRFFLATPTLTVIHRDGKILLLNPAALVLSGAERAEDLEGKSILDFLEHGARPLFEERIRRAQDCGESSSPIRTKIVRPDGTERIIEIAAVPTTFEGMAAVQSVGRDVTEELMLQKQLIHAQKMESIGTLAGGIAHDFNNLLTIILGYSDMLVRSRGLEALDRKKLEAIRLAARDGSDLVKRILTFSRKVEPKIRPIDLNAELRRIERLLYRTLSKMISIRLITSDDIKPVKADPAQIEQVILNLGVNASHAMPDGGRLVMETRNVSLDEEFARAHFGASPGEFVLLTVSDTGTGMTPEVAERIFEPFFTTKKDGEGTGLGLAMVHGIIAQHGGYITCYSEPGLGAEFKIFLPVHRGPENSEVKAADETPAVGDETILLVDDDPAVRQFGNETLTWAGYRVLTARNGREALELYRSRADEISLVILDLIMPEMDGTQCLAELLRLNPEVKALIASGYSAHGPTKVAVEQGAKGFVGKPFDMKQLLKAVREALDRK